MSTVVTVPTVLVVTTPDEVVTTVVTEQTIVAVAAPGPQGPPGPAGPAGDETGLGYVHVQSSPAQLVQIQHGLPYKPAGIQCIESDGITLEYSTLSHPAPGITELTFGVGFSGVIYVS